MKRFLHCLMDQELAGLVLSEMLGRDVRIEETPRLRPALESCKDQPDVIVVDSMDRAYTFNFGRWTDAGKLIYEMQRSAARLLQDYEEVHATQIVEPTVAEAGMVNRLKTPCKAGLHLHIVQPFQLLKEDCIFSSELLASIERHSATSLPTLEESIIAESRGWLKLGAARAAERGCDDLSGAFAEQFAAGYTEGFIAARTAGD